MKGYAMKLLKRMSEWRNRRSRTCLNQCAGFYAGTVFSRTGTGSNRALSTPVCKSPSSIHGGDQYLTRSSRRKRRGCLVATLLLLQSVDVVRAQYDASIFEHATAQFLGASIVRPNERYDLQPTVLYDQADPERLFKMWWLGRYAPEDVDKRPFDLEPEDRIYFAYSKDGTVWSKPVVVLKGQGGMGKYDAADDHLIGSPTVIRIKGKYYMYYEAYGTQMTMIPRMFSVTAGDTWSSNGQLHTRVGEWSEDYQLERMLGIAPLFVKWGTHPIYSGEVIYANGKVNRFVTARKEFSADPSAISSWRWLNGGEPVFWLYDRPGTGRKPLYAAFDSQFSNSFVTDDPKFEGRLPDGFNGMEPPNALLGYAIESPDSPDMRHANQNRICLATSENGVDWTRFRGAAPGGAIVAPLEAFTNSWPHQCGANVTPELGSAAPERFDLHRAYGSGFPCVLVRDSFVELYFSDDTADSGLPLEVCVRPPLPWRIRIPLAKIDNPQAYVSAERQARAPYGCDMKWSPMLQRYVAMTFVTEGSADPCDPNFRQYPELVWSPFMPDPDQPTRFPAKSEFSSRLPIGNFIGVCSGLLGNELGHTVEFPAASPPYIAFHIFHEAAPMGKCGSVFERDIHHVLLFGYPKASPDMAGLRTATDRVGLRAANVFNLEISGNPYGSYLLESAGDAADQAGWMLEKRIEMGPATKASVSLPWDSEAGAKFFRMRASE